MKGGLRMSRIEILRNKGFTVMSNHHLRNKNLSCKAKGLMSFMLSLPEDWDYSVKGLSSVLKESEKAIRTILKEIEEHGYLSRKREKDSDGRFSGIDYILSEIPFMWQEELEDPVDAEIENNQSEDLKTKNLGGACKRVPYQAALDYHKENGYQSDLSEWFTYWSFNEWRYNNGKLLKNWKKSIDYWEKGFKKGQKPKKNGFQNFEQRDIDFDDLERRIAEYNTRHYGDG